eukprot:CAMPEP_0175830530 /NCGR_PEP_ID=MMETSP0107_2-20121207/13980_1 /TAXON_ID=195067 ORGANISM="Goniomonas pacifica, Strain CCMP1869" /NCGR_SAMPLE_ID=MMETSP0107_2 /ASSEMBLY_ACC=CAM_ASM_000203 /LENGTH=53 /DNA_ID=CAMNT_0017143507 /DNA_START=356 /DNA_END=517 /DNA_ORIENTATION=+
MFSPAHFAQVLHDYLQLSRQHESTFVPKRTPAMVRLRELLDDDSEADTLESAL